MQTAIERPLAGRDLADFGIYYLDMDEALGFCVQAFDAHEDGSETISNRAVTQYDSRTQKGVELARDADGKFLRDGDEVCRREFTAPMRLRFDAEFDKRDVDDVAWLIERQQDRQRRRDAGEVLESFWVPDDTQADGRGATP